MNNDANDNIKKATAGINKAVAEIDEFFRSQENDIKSLNTNAAAIFDECKEKWDPAKYAVTDFLNNKLGEKRLNESLENFTKPLAKTMGDPSLGGFRHDLLDIVGTIKTYASVLENERSKQLNH